MGIGEVGTQRDRLPQVLSADNEIALFDEDGSELAVSFCKSRLEAQGLTQVVHGPITPAPGEKESGHAVMDLGRIRRNGQGRLVMGPRLFALALCGHDTGQLQMSADVVGCPDEDFLEVSPRLCPAFPPDVQFCEHGVVAPGWKQSPSVYHFEMRECCACVRPSRTGLSGEVEVW